MSVFVHKHSRVIIQGFTGQHATFHAEESMKNGTTVVGGVTPGKGGQTHLDLPVFDTVSQAVAETGADVSGIFVPPPFAADAIMESLEAGIGVIVVIADGIPVQDMVRVKRYAADKDAIIIGPNTPGIITPSACKVGIMPSHIYTPGRIGVVRSEELDGLSSAPLLFSVDLILVFNILVSIALAYQAGLICQERLLSPKWYRIISM